MTTQPSKNSIGVIVARFQVAELHAGHKWLIQQVAAQHEHLLIILGTSIVKGSPRNPLTFADRKAMLESEVSVLGSDTSLYLEALPDHSSDVTWSSCLDGIIDRFVDLLIHKGEFVDRVAPYQDAILYGARDSFIPYYKGSYQVQQLEVPAEMADQDFYSGTAMRKALLANPPHSANYRAGKIVSTGDRYPINYMCVDAVIYNPAAQAVLLGRKPGEDKFRFIGGFSDPTDASLEAAVIREVGEEVRIVDERLEVDCPLTIDSAKYLTSIRIDDPRYRSEPDKIMSAVFICKTNYYHNLEGDDDIEEVKWFKITELSNLDIMEPHKVIVEALKKRWKPMKNFIKFSNQL